MRYQPLELGQAGNPKCPDNYDNESTLICPACRRIVVQVSGEPAVVQCGTMPQGVGLGAGSVQWQAEEPYMAGASLTFGRTFDAVRVRNYTPGKEAQIFVTVS